MNGIGGSTIAQAQANMTYPEFMVWCKFRGRRGSLNPGMRIEAAVARLSAFYGNCRSGKPVFEIEDFAPHMDRKVLSLDEAMAAWA